MKLPKSNIIPVMFSTFILMMVPEIYAQSGMITIPEGSYHSVLPEVVGEPVQVQQFKLDKTAVTNRQFLEFLENNPRWHRSEIQVLYAEAGYLNHWQNDLHIGGESELDKPVTRVSWFAANAFCGWKSGRLPTLNEWEYAAQLMDFNSAKDANRFSVDLIGWYSAVDAQSTAVVGSTGIENRYGVQDMFGLVMEWVEDFKPPVGEDISLDCGTIGRMKGDSTLYSYAMSIRFITRMSFSPTSTTGMLGFRCAYDTPQKL